MIAIISVLSAIAAALFPTATWLGTVLQAIPLIIGLFTGSGDLFNKGDANTGTDNGQNYMSGAQTGSGSQDTGSQADDNNSSPGSVDFDSQLSTPSSDEQYVIKAINKFRADNGLNQLSVSPWIQYKAKERLQYSQKINYCDTSHTGKYLTFPTLFNEVAVYTFSLEDIVEEWKKSPSHRAALLDQAFGGLKHNYIGVVVGHAPVGDDYFCSFAILSPYMQPQ